MATTNFLAWDAPQNNIETDAQYAADAMRTNGAATGGILPSPTFNKFALQTSTMVAALAQMLAAKGYSTSDANQASLAAVLSNIQTAADLKSAQIQVPYSPSMTFDCSLATGFRVNIAGNVTSSNMINVPPPGAVVTFFLVSANPGNYSFAWPGNVFFAPNVQTQSTGNLMTYQFVSDGTNMFSLSTFQQFLQSEIQALQGQTSALQGNVSTLQGQTSSLQGSVSTLQGQVSALQSGKQNNLGFTPVQQGTGVGQSNANTVKVGWAGNPTNRLKATVDASDLGGFVFDSQLQSALAGLVSSSPGTNGWLNIGGIIIQWATGYAQATGSNVQQNIGFPMPFPNACWAVVPGSSSSNASDGKPQSYTVVSVSTSSVTLQQLRADGQGSITTTPTIIAIGN